MDGEDHSVSPGADRPELADPSADDTIVALATPPGTGALAVVRLSGAAAARIATAVVGRLPPPRQAGFRTFRDATGAAIDQGLVLRFQGPASYTGEDLVELHGHGSPVAVTALLEQLQRQGARPARPGEFTERAFLNGRLDLAQAEAVADLVGAASRAGLIAANRSLSGAFSREVDALLDALTTLRMRLEAAIDFPEEAAGGADAADTLAAIEALAAALAERARSGLRVMTRPVVVLAGAPNVGKSSLLNALAGEDAAIVTEVPGTTRDSIERPACLDGLEVTLVDTAGLRESGDIVEREGMRRTTRRAGEADLVLWVSDTDRADVPDTVAPGGGTGAGIPVRGVRNKIDRDALDPGEEVIDGHTRVRVSALTGAGLDRLARMVREVLVDRSHAAGEDGGLFSARARHLDALARSRACLAEASAALAADPDAPECLAEYLRLAHLNLAEITGGFTADDLLGRIFAEFCIGK